MAGPIQVGDIIKFSEIALKVWEYGWASERNAGLLCQSLGDNYRAFGNDVKSLHRGLKNLEDAVNEAQTSLRTHGARETDILGGDQASLAEIIGDYNQTLDDCRNLLKKNLLYDQTTGPARNIEWNISIMPRVDHLRGRIQMHNSRIESLLRPFQIDLVNKIHGDLVRRLTSLHSDVLGIRRDINMLLATYFPDVAKTIEQQREQEFHSVSIPDYLQNRLEVNLERRSRTRRLDQPLTLPELTDCFLMHLDRSTVNFQPGTGHNANCPPVASYIELLKCQLLMNKIKKSSKLRNPPSISHWPGYVDALEGKLSQQCARFQTELVAPDTSGCDDEVLAFWPDDALKARKPGQSSGPPYDFLLEVKLANETDAMTSRMIQVLRRAGSEHHFRIVETCGHIDDQQPQIKTTEEPKVVDFDSHAATLIPIYADPVDEDGAVAPLEMILEYSYRSYQYTFLDMADVLSFQEAITGFKVVSGYTESRAQAVFVRPGMDKLSKENATVQLWIPLNAKSMPEKDIDDGLGQGRPSSTSQNSERPNLGRTVRTNSHISSQSTAAMSCKSWGSSGSEETISIKVDGAGASTGYAVIRRRPRSPLLVLFTRDLSAQRKRSIMAILVDDETRPNPERCRCQNTRDCRIAALERKHGRFMTVGPQQQQKQKQQQQQLESRAKWNLLRLMTTAPSWSGLLRVSIFFPTVEARHEFSGSHCGCKILTESDVNDCLGKGHQGHLGWVRVYYRRQMIRWQDQKDKQREVDTFPPSGFSNHGNMRQI